MTRSYRLKIEWQESEQELYERFQAEKEVRTKQRLQFLWLVRGGRTIRESSRLAGIQERVGQRYMKWYRNGGIAEVVGRKHGGSDRNQQGFLTEEQGNQLKVEADTGRIKTVWDGIEWVKEQFGIQFSYEGMRSVYKRLRLRKKVPRPQHIKSDPDEQEEWKKGVWSTN